MLFSCYLILRWLPASTLGPEKNTASAYLTAPALRNKTTLFITFVIFAIFALV
jgi:hypothetical protein